MKYVPPLADVKAVLMPATPEQMEIIKCVYHSVARVGEVLNLKWEDVNFERPTVTLWTRRRKRGERRPMIKPMNAVLFELLKHKRLLSECMVKSSTEGSNLSPPYCIFGAALGPRFWLPSDQAVSLLFFVFLSRPDTQ